jgi:hypothetical protein
VYEALSYLFIIRSVLRGCVSGGSYLAICAIYSVCYLIRFRMRRCVLVHMHLHVIRAIDSVRYLIRFRMRRCVSGCSYLAEGDAQWSVLVNSAKLTKPLFC